MDGAIRPFAGDGSPRVTVATYVNQNEAAIAASMLQSRGIDATLQDEHASGAYGVANFMIGGVKLTVPHSDADLSQSLLEAPIDINSDALQQERPQRDCRRCPICGQPGAQARYGILYWAGLAAAAIAGALIAGPIAALFIVVGLRWIRGKRYRCSSCARSWRQT